MGRKTFCSLSPFYQRLFLTASSTTTKHSKFIHHSTLPRLGIPYSALGWGHSPLQDGAVPSKMGEEFGYLSS